ncbi:MAG: hypothetical protein ABIO04_07740 [Ferruginibacter sp.]
MHIIQFFVIIFLSAFTGWLISFLVIKMLLSPSKAITFFGISIQGLIPANKDRIANGTGQLVQKEFLNYKGFEEKLSDPSLLAKLKPEIEAHVEHFLKEKLKAVFPLLSQFMGEKTLTQFKTAFLLEIDNLLPIMIKNYLGGLKSDLKLDTIIAERISSIPTAEVQRFLYSNAKKQIRNLQIACSVIGFLIGLITVGILVAM